MAIHLLTGLPGSGKTYVQTMFALHFLEQGIPVHANYDIYDERVKRWSALRDLVNIKGPAVILIDEAQVYMNSRKWQQLPEWFQVKLQQSRKDSLQIWATTQDISFVDSTFRVLIQDYYECKKIFNIVRVNKYSPKDAKKVKRERMQMKFYRMKEEVFKKYDTFYKVSLPV